MKKQFFSPILLGAAILALVLAGCQAEAGSGFDAESGVIITLLAGSTGGYADGNGGAAKFNAPSGVAVDAGGNVYVADSNNNKIRKISPLGEVSTLAGSTSGYADGNGGAAKFDYPPWCGGRRRGKCLCGGLA